ERSPDAPSGGTDSRQSLSAPGFGVRPQRLGGCADSPTKALERPQEQRSLEGPPGSGTFGEHSGIGGRAREFSEHRRPKNALDLTRAVGPLRYQAQPNDRAVAEQIPQSVESWTGDIDLRQRRLQHHDHGLRGQEQSIRCVSAADASQVSDHITRPRDQRLSESFPQRPQPNPVPRIADTVEKLHGALTWYRDQVIVKGEPTLRTRLGSHRQAEQPWAARPADPVRHKTRKHSAAHGVTLGQQHLARPRHRQPESGSSDTRRSAGRDQAVQRHDQPRLSVTTSTTIPAAACRATALLSASGTTRETVV